MTVTTPLAEGQRIQYNFVKPHMALNGMTPSKYDGRWKELLKLAAENDN